MAVGTPLLTIPVSFFDRHTGLSALAVQHVRIDGRTAVVYHDAPGPAAARPLLSGVAETLMAELSAGQTLGLIETSIPEHAAESFVYARLSLSFTAWTGRVNADTERVVSPEAVARACGIDVSELVETEAIVLSIHRRRACAFPGFRQLDLGDRNRRALAVA